MHKKACSALIEIRVKAGFANVSMDKNGSVNESVLSPV